MASEGEPYKIRREPAGIPALRDRRGRDRCAWELG